MKQYIRSLVERLFSNFATKRDLDNLFVQLSAVMELKQFIGPELLIGPFRDWALSPDALLIVVRDILSRRDCRVLEFGAGESTIAIAATLRKLGAGRLMTVEHDPQFARQIDDRLRQARLEQNARICVAPLKEYRGFHGFPPFHSYDLSSIDSEAAFDVALIDGPISTHGPATRAVPLAHCIEMMTEDCVVYLDDAARAGEQSVLRHFSKTTPKVAFTYLRTEKGLARLSPAR